MDNKKHIKKKVGDQRTDTPAPSKEKKGKKMKKMILTIVAMLSITTMNAGNKSAENVDNNNINVYDMSVNMRRLAITLGLTDNQMEAVESIHETFNAEMLFAANLSEEERKAMVEKAVSKDVKFMRYILDDKQYRKYLMLLNITLNNRGLNK